MDKKFSIESIKEKIDENLKRTREGSPLIQRTVHPPKKGLADKLREYIIYKGLRYKDILVRYPLFYNFARRIYRRIKKDLDTGALGSITGVVQKIISWKELSELTKLEGDDFIRRSYQVILGREPDTEGLNTYIELLKIDGKKAKKKIIKFIALSEEARDLRISVELPFYDRVLIKIINTIKKIPLFNRLAGRIFRFIKLPLEIQAIKSRMDIFGNRIESNFTQLLSRISDIENKTKAGFELTEERLNQNFYKLNDEFKTIEDKFSKIDNILDRIRFELNWMFKLLNAEEKVEITQPFRIPFISSEFQITGSGRDESIMGDIRALNGYYEIHLMNLLPHIIKPDDICFDIGANIGIFSIACSVLTPKGRVYAFEPSVNNFNYLVKNIQCNNINNVIPLNLGLDEESGEKFFFFRKYFTGGSYLTTDKNKSGEIEIVKCVTLDEWVKKNNINRIDFIKIDVEGAELKVINGAKETINRFRPDLVIEYNINTLSQFFNVPADFLFLKLKEIYPAIFLIKRRDSSLVELKNFDEFYEIIKHEGGVGDLFCTFKAINRYNAHSH